MARTLLIRGMIVGLVAGLLLFAVARVWGEPQVDRAIAFESAMDAAQARAAALAGHPVQAPDPVLVSRPMQAGWGLFTGTMVYGTAFGGLFALVFAFIHGRVGVASPRLVSALLGLGGFVAAFVVPDLKYPSNPPSVGLPETIAIRTEAYVAMMLCSIGAMAGAIAVGRHLAGRHGAWNAGIVGAAFYGAFVAVVMLILPVVQEVPPGFDAVVLWKFRIATAAMQFAMWATLGLGFGALAERVMPGPYDRRGRASQAGFR